MTQSRDFHILIVTAHVIRHLPEQASAVSDKVTFILLIHCVLSCCFKLSIVVLKLFKMFTCKGQASEDKL